MAGETLRFRVVNSVLVTVEMNTIDSEDRQTESEWEVPQHMHWNRKQRKERELRTRRSNITTFPWSSRLSDAKARDQ